MGLWVVERPVVWHANKKNIVLAIEAFTSVLIQIQKYEKRFKTQPDFYFSLRYGSGKSSSKRLN